MTKIVVGENMILGESMVLGENMVFGENKLFGKNVVSVFFLVKYNKVQSSLHKLPTLYTEICTLQPVQQFPDRVNVNPGP